MHNGLLFTGASGFLGTHLKPILCHTYDVSTIGLSKDDDININIANEIPVLHNKYRIVLHAAGRAHMVPKTENERQAFFDVNYQGTVNLCSALEKAGIPKSFIFISTVAVYGVEHGSNIHESHALNGLGAYAESKKKAEEYLINWSKDHNVILTILRPSLIAGPNPPGNLGAMINGINKGRYLSIHNGRARKSVLMVQDIANLIPLVSDRGGIYNVCDDHHPSFGELEALISKQLGKNKPMSIPLWMAKCMALVGDLLGSRAPINSEKLSKIKNTLTFSNEKAKKELGWEPMNVLENFRIK